MPVSRAQFVSMIGAAGISVAANAQDKTPYHLKGVDAPSPAVRLAGLDDMPGSKLLTPRVLDALQIAGLERAYGDTFDSEVFLADAAFTSFAFLDDQSTLPHGQSLLHDGNLQPSGTSIISGFDLSTIGREFDNGDGTYLLLFNTLIDPLSDGFVPLGVGFVGGPLIDALIWDFGNLNADRDGTLDDLDPNLVVPFPPTGEFDIVAAELAVFDNGTLLGAFPLSVVPALNQSAISFSVALTGVNGSGVDELAVVYLVEPVTTTTQLTLDPVDDCLDASETQFIVEINAAGLNDLAAGGQFFLEYDETLLDFVSADVGDAPFTREVFEFVDEGNGVIDYAVGVQDGDLGTAAPTTMARITFDVLGDFCDAAGLVTFRPAAFPPSRISNPAGTDLGAALIDMPNVTKDSVAPVLSVPSDIFVNADAGLCTASLSVTPATATDNCSAAPVVTFERQDNPALTLADPFPTGSTEIVWTATDDCGNQSTGAQFVNVAAFSTLQVVVELSPAVEPATFERCITFDLYPSNGDPTVEVKAVLAFTGGIANASIDVPCGEYDCITARDTLHTLRATDQDDFAIVGSVYVSDFTDDAGDDDRLIGGNLNDDAFIDILDFGGFIGQFGVNYGAPDTTCATIPIHADISGDGIVGTGDFTFITNNFLSFSEVDCDGLLSTGAPMASVRVRDLAGMGLAHLAEADLNGDRVIDESDIAAFASGVRPISASDVNRDGAIDMADLNVVLGSFGQQTPAGDANGDSMVDFDDLLMVIDNFGVVLK